MEKHIRPDKKLTSPPEDFYEEIFDILEEAWTIEKYEKYRESGFGTFEQWLVVETPFTLKLYQAALDAVNRGDEIPTEILSEVMARILEREIAEFQ